MRLLVDDLLLLARLDEGRPLEREPVELDDVVARGGRDGAAPSTPDRPIDARRASRRPCSATATASARSSTTCSRTCARTRRPGLRCASASAPRERRRRRSRSRTRARAERGRGERVLRALLPRRRVALARERRRRPRPLDRRRGRRGARRHGRRAADAGRRRDVRDAIPLLSPNRRHEHRDQRGSPDMTEHELTRRRLLELGLALPPLAALAAGADASSSPRPRRCSPRRPRSRTTTSRRLR